LHPSGVAKSSTSFGWGKGWNVTSAGLQVTLRDPIWHVSSSSGVATSVSELLYPCYFTLLYFTPPTLLWGVWHRFTFYYEEVSVAETQLSRSLVNDHAAATATAAMVMTLIMMMVVVVVVMMADVGTAMADDDFCCVF